MGLFDSIGRSNALSSVGNNILEGAQGLVKTNLILDKMSRDNQLEQKKMGILEAEEARKVDAFNKQKAAYERPMNVKLHPMFRMLPEDVQSEALREMESSDVIDNRGIGQTGKIAEFTKGVESSGELFGKWMGRVLETRREEVGKLADKYAKETDPAKKEQLKKEYMGALESLMISEGKYAEHVNLLKEQPEKFPSSDFATFAAAGRAKGWDNERISKEWHKMKMEEASVSARARGEGFAVSRAVNVLDTSEGNRPKVMNLAEVNEMNKLEPGRYIPAGEGSKALNKTALVEDIRGTIIDARTALQAMPEFSAPQAAQIALMLKHRDPRSAFSNFMASRWGQTLSPEQQDYLVSLTQLIENAMAMRSVLGAGQGSEDLRAAISATIPSARTPSKAFAAKQLDAFERVLNRLSRGIPNVPLAPPSGPIQAQGANNALPAGLPQGTTDNGDGTYTLPNGKRVRPKR